MNLEANHSKSLLLFSMMQTEGSSSHLGWTKGLELAFAYSPQVTSYMSKDECFKKK